MEQLVYDLRLAARNVQRRGRLSAVIVITLAVGIACATAMFSVVRGVLLRPLPWPDAGRMAMVWNVPPAGTEDLQLSEPEIVDLAQMLEGVAVGCFHGGSSSLMLDGNAEAIPTSRASRAVYDILRARVAVGRSFAAEDFELGAERVVIVGHQLWQNAFGGDPGLVGRTLELDGTPHQVVGVMAPGLLTPVDMQWRERTQLWQPMALEPARLAPRQVRWANALARLDEGMTWERAQAALDRAVDELRRRHPEHYEAGWRMRLVPMPEQLLGDVRPAILALFGAVFFVLMIACANVAHLMLAHHGARRRELAVRSALGAPRGRLVRELMLESLLLALGAGALGVVLARAAISGLLALRPGNLPRVDGVTIDPAVLLFALGAALTTALAFGLLPAFQAAGTGLRTALFDAGRGAVGGLRGLRGRRLVLVAEVALATVLLSGAGLLIETLRHAARAELGFAPGGLVAAGVKLPFRTGGDADPRAMRFWQALQQAAAEQPGVELVSQTTVVPFYSALMSRPIEVRGADAAQQEVPRVIVEMAAPGIAAALGTPLMAGRDLLATDRAGSAPVVLVNEALARQLLAERGTGDGAVATVVGRHLRFPDGAWLRIVGVVSNVVHDSLEAPPAARVIVPHRQLAEVAGWRQPSFFWLLLRTASDPAPAMAAARAALRSIDPGLPVSPLVAMDDHVAQAGLSRYRFAAFVLGIFAAVAVVLALAGLYGLLTYLVSSGRREIGVRMALGARRVDILRQVNRQSLTMTLLGLALGIPSALALTGLIESLLYGVVPTEPVAFLATALLLLAVAMAASYLPARRAAAVEPVEVLRSE